MPGGRWRDYIAAVGAQSTLPQVQSLIKKSEGNTSKLDRHIENVDLISQKCFLQLNCMFQSCCSKTNEICSSYKDTDMWTCEANVRLSSLRNT